MQFVFVDDASPDNSIAILYDVLSRYPERKGQYLIVRHDYNMGLPIARKTGLDYINAEYVAHCDSDDWVEPNMYERMYLCACSNDADMVVCGNKPKSLFSDNHYLKALLIFRDPPPAVWLRLTRTEIYRHINFPDCSYFEDWVQSVQIHAYSKIINFISEPLYHYRNTPSSITKSLNIFNCDEKLRQSMTNMKIIQDFLLSNHLLEEKDLVFMKIFVRKRLVPKLLLRQCRRQYLNTYPEINWILFKKRSLPWYYKVEHIAICLNLYPEWHRLKMKYLASHGFLRGKWR